jgi:hypothetical protein
MTLAKRTGKVTYSAVIYCLSADHKWMRNHENPSDSHCTALRLTALHEGQSDSLFVSSNCVINVHFSNFKLDPALYMTRFNVHGVFNVLILRNPQISIFCDVCRVI